ncbi:MAG: response regulator [Burkholderiales bacterium]
MADILVVDDEIGIRELLNEILGDEGHTVLLAENAAQARQFRDEQDLDLVLLDIWMPEVDGVSLLKEWAAIGKLSMPVIMMSGHATIDTAVEATRIGALDFLEKPISLQKLLKTVENGLARRAISRGVPRPQPAAPVTPRPVAGPGAALQAGATTSPDIEPPFFEAALTADGSPATGEQTRASDRYSVPSLEVSSGLTGAAHGSGAGGSNTVAAIGALAADRLGVVTAVVATAGGGPGSLRELPLDMPLREARDAFERTYFEHHLAREQGSMTRVAEKTGLERTHLYRKLKQLGIDLSKGAFRKGGAGQA